MTRSLQHTDIVVGIAILVIAALTRGHLISASPLWFDEIYAYLLAHDGLDAFFAVHRVHPHPPFWYLLQWLSSGATLSPSPFVARWVAWFSGTISVGLFYIIARLHVQTGAALLASILFAYSPFHIFYSQEARPYTFSVLLVVISLFFLSTLINSPAMRYVWVGLTIVWIAGIYIVYNFTLIVAIQIAYLVLFVSRRATFIAAASVAVIVLPLAVGAVSVVFDYGYGNPSSAAVPVWMFVQSLLAGEPARFGWSWSHIFVPSLIVILILPALGYIRTNSFLAYNVAQFTLPFIIFFGIFVPAFGSVLALHEAKQFIVLLPACYIIIAYGADKWFRILRPSLLRWGTLGAMTLALLIAQHTFLVERVWGANKSPEGYAAQFVVAHAEPEDAILSLSHATDAALWFYKNQRTPLPYVRPFPDDASFLVQRPTYYSFVISTEAEINTIDEVQAHSRIWLLGSSNTLPELQQFLLEHCTHSQTHDFSPFYVWLLTTCTP